MRTGTESIDWGASCGPISFGQTKSVPQSGGRPLTCDGPHSASGGAHPLKETNVVPSADEYGRYRPLLFRGLASLARQGYELAADEGLELVHDFFIEVWSGLHERYEPSKGAFSTYVFGAFLRFARPRIVKSRRWRERLVALEPRELDELGAPGPDKDRQAETDSLRRGLACLPDEDLKFLVRWLAVGSSERQLAKAVRLSRYRVRERLVGVLARLAVVMDERIGQSENDWRVAKLLWGEERTVTETAILLGLTPTQVKLARQRVRDVLANGLSREHARSRSAGEECNVR